MTEPTDAVQDAIRAAVRDEVRAARKRDRWVLTSWGVAVLLLAGMFSLQLYRVQREKDRAMCTIIALITAGPQPVPGPAGDRGRVVLGAMRAYQATLGCRR